MISAWPGLVSGPADEPIDDSLVLLEPCAALGLPEVEVIARRAEELGHEPRLRESFDLAVARALAPTPVLVELCLPLVRVGGRLLAQKTYKEEAAAAERAIGLLGGSLDAIVAAPSSARRSGTVMIVSKVKPTPAAYPRRAAVPARKPL